MKLRLRSLESKETHRIEVPDPCTLRQLKDFLIQTLSSSVSAASLRFSLNRKDEIHGTSPEDPLPTFGITSGDLIFFTFDPSGFSSQQATPIQASQSLSQTQDDSSGSGRRIQLSNFDLTKSESENSYAPESADEGEKILGLDSDKMDIDDESESIEAMAKKYSKPTFLRRVLKEELGHDRNAHKLLTTSVHAVLLESGFIPINLNSGAEKEKHLFHIPSNWPSSSFMTSIRYTLPELLAKENESSAMSGIVCLKFQSLGHFVNVYGSLDHGRGSSVYRVSLDDKKFAPYLDLVWANSDSSSMVDETEGYAERQIFEFWKVVKDALALPLLIDLCEKLGLSAPANFMRLPGDLKLKILEALPGLDIAKLECVCTELRYLASSNDLWKLKFNQEFSSKVRFQGNGHWKARYVTYLKNKKMRDRAITRWRSPNSGRVFWPTGPRRQPYPFGFPHVIGGDYDVGPGNIRMPPFGSYRGPLRHGLQPNCDLGVENAYRI